MSVRQVLRTIKRLPFYSLFGRWRPRSDFEPGYTIALPMPMDMPFLLRLALEGLAGLKTPNCKEIIVLPDGCGNDNGRALQAVVADFSDPRLTYLPLNLRDKLTRRIIPQTNSARIHWRMAVNAIDHSRCEYVFLHDADAFFLSADGLEKQYQEALTRRMDVLGVTPRWDPFFLDHEMQIAGTWEMLFSTGWARRRSPMALFPGTWGTTFGDFAFDSMLYAQFLDYHKGSIGVMTKPPEFVHFNGTIVTYRLFRDSKNTQVNDELFRILLLSLLETAIGITDSKRTTPRVNELVLGMTEPNARVSYRQEISRRGYGEFRKMVEQMLGAPAFGGSIARTIREAIEPFDRHFDFDPSREYSAAVLFGKVRKAGLGE